MDPTAGLLQHRGEVSRAAQLLQVPADGGWWAGGAESWCLLCPGLNGPAAPSEARDRGPGDAVLFRTLSLIFCVTLAAGKTSLPRFCLLGRCRAWWGWPCWVVTAHTMLGSGSSVNTGLPCSTLFSHKCSYSRDFLFCFKYDW